jgi:diphosphomevalonate decarboxylase
MREATSFAATNIALCKYWGKRNKELNLPVTSSLSLSLADKGARVHVQFSPNPADEISLNGVPVAADSQFALRLVEFLNLFRGGQSWHLRITITMNIPVAAGLASSACGFASLVLALNELFSWQLSPRKLSILARLGSGSAARSIQAGFVEWHAGVQADGMDSYAERLPLEWPELRVGLHIVNTQAKPLSSREAMQRTVDTSVLYTAWPKKVARDLVIMRQALHNKNFSLLAGAAESNALSMHATMLSAWPPICYTLPETLAAMHAVWALRQAGTEVYFTQDAGPNLKLLFCACDAEKVRAAFPGLEICTVG